MAERDRLTLYLDADDTRVLKWLALAGETSVSRYVGNLLHPHVVDAMRRFPDDLERVGVSRQRIDNHINLARYLGQAGGSDVTR
jgi:hypothetical protein